MKRVLLIEDNPNERLMIRDTISRIAGQMKIECEVVVMINAKEAIEYLNSCHSASQLPDLVITDLDMPLMGGFGFIEKVKVNPRFKRIPIVVFSSMDHDEDVKKVYEDRANGFVKKPFGLSAFEETIRSMLSFWLTLNIFSH